MCVSRFICLCYIRSYISFMALEETRKIITFCGKRHELYYMTTVTISSLLGPFFKPYVTRVLVLVPFISAAGLLQL